MKMKNYFIPLGVSLACYAAYLALIPYLELECSLFVIQEQSKPVFNLLSLSFLVGVVGVGLIMWQFMKHGPETPLSKLKMQVLFLIAAFGMGVPISIEEISASGDFQSCTPIIDN